MGLGKQQALIKKFSTNSANSQQTSTFFSSKTYTGMQRDKNSQCTHKAKQAKRTCLLKLILKLN